VVEDDSLSFEQAITDLKESLQEAYKAEDKLKELMGKAGLTS